MLRIEKALVDEIIAHSQEQDPNECCGFLAGNGKTAKKSYRITNVHPNKETRFEMSVQEHINARRDWESNRWDIMAIYHSHPKGKAHPSRTDVSLALHGGWWDVHHIVISLESKTGPIVRAFEITRRGEVIEKELMTI